MRFRAGGPIFPDELLVARDEGRVVFFCGAGVSRARAGLPDFFGLAEAVVDSLGVAANNPVRRIIAEAREMDGRVGIGGLISADRIFGLLEHDFSPESINSAVAAVLKPKEPIDLSAHQIILDLAKGPDGLTRLVTTNFDLLFEQCNGALRSSRPPHLPNPARPIDFDGIIHLHGHVGTNYDCASGDGFILSSSTFGQAYLSEAWATQFIREIIAKYVVVFLGYAADDPPVRYLLEALKTRAGSLEGVFALHAGTEADGEYQWKQKGVRPISYDPANHHSQLWESLEAWAARAKDPEAWYRSRLQLALAGPEALTSHERGQIAHIASTILGAKMLAVSDKVPPATWLCVFDPSIRYATPGNLGYIGERGPYFDPFEAYGLDDDPVPNKIRPDHPNVKREVPKGIWDCFALTSRDYDSLRSENLPALHGYRSTNVPDLAARLSLICRWIGRVASEPAAVWWAAGKGGMHPGLQRLIELQLASKANSASTEVRKAWRYIFEAWRDTGRHPHEKWFDCQRRIERDGWSTAACRAFIDAIQPRLSIGRPLFGGPKPPSDRTDVRQRELIDMDVKYFELDANTDISAEYLAFAVKLLRHSLIDAIELEKELGGYGLDNLCAIRIDSDTTEQFSERDFGISKYVLFYVDLVERLISIDSRAARAEYFGWAANHDQVSSRLTIWFCGHEQVVTDEEVGLVLAELSDDAFWGSRHRRDLLITVAHRWNKLADGCKERLEHRFLRGRSRFEFESEGEFAERAATLTLNCIHWLLQEGCKFSFDVSAESERLRRVTPDWKPSWAKSAIDSIESRSGWVREDTDCTALLSAPLDRTIAAAAELSGRLSEAFVEKAPFVGLSSERPARALAALRSAAKRAEYPEWAWTTFLNSSARSSDGTRLASMIASCIVAMPSDVLGRLMQAVADWFERSSKCLQGNREGGASLWRKILHAIRDFPECARSSLVTTSEETDWATAAINAPAGKLAETLMKVTNTDAVTDGDRKFQEAWISRVDELLSLGGGSRNYALVIFSFNLDWFYSIDPDWAERNILRFIDCCGDARDAVFAGFFWRAKVPQKALFMRLKPSLIEVAKEATNTKRRYLEVVAGMLLAGWGSRDSGSGQRLISDQELRELLLESGDEFRCQVLYHLRRWSASGESDWNAELQPFFSGTWPRQKNVKTSRVSAALCDFALSRHADFPGVVDLIAPCISKIESEHTFAFAGEQPKILTTTWPHKVLDLLALVLPENVSAWPYGSHEILDKIGTSQPDLLKDARLIELKRLWNAH